MNEQTNEIEKLEEQIQQLKEEEQKYAQESGDDVHQHKQILRELEMKLQSTENMVEKYESRCQDTQKTIESLKKGIQSMFTKVECDTENMLSDSTVTEANILQYLGLIEQRCNDISAVRGNPAEGTGEGKPPAERRKARARRDGWNPGGA